MAGEVSIDFSELQQFAARLRGVNLPAQLQDAQRDAADLITRDAIPKIPVLTGDARGSIVITQGGRGVGIRAGVGVPYFGWLDFGGAVGPNKSIRRPYLRTGRYIWRSFADHLPQIMQRFEKAIADAFGTEGINVD